MSIKGSIVAAWPFLVLLANAGAEPHLSLPVPPIPPANPTSRIPMPDRPHSRDKGAVFLSRVSDELHQTLWLCKAGDGTAGRRLTCSDARVGYRISGFRPGLVPVLQRASARSRPPSGAREFPTVVSSPALHNGCSSFLVLFPLLNHAHQGATVLRLQ